MLIKRRRASILAVLLTAVTLLITPTLAAADNGVETGYNSVVVHTDGSKDTPGKQGSSGSSGKPKYTYVPKDEYQKRMKAWRADVAAIMAANAKAATARDNCITSTTEFGCNRFGQTPLPGELNIRPAGDPVPGAGLDPTTIAYIAVARLTLTPPKPGIGPSPEINPWKMAAVGFPLWLWADGNLDPAPVSQSVYDLTVSLDAHLVKVVYDMGDGHKVTCTDPTHRWSRSVKAGAPSPWCGYRYQKPSLPKGDYTVTANIVWAVNWRINDATGTIPLYQSASTTIPVGELQVLVR